MQRASVKENQGTDEAPRQVDDQRLAHLKAIAELVELWIKTIAIVAAGGWAFYTFVFKEIRVPRSEVGHLSGKAELRIVAAKDPYRALEATIFIKNNSRKNVKLLAGLVEVVGTRFIGDIQTGSLENVPWRPLQGEPRPIITRYDTARDIRVLMVSDPIRGMDLGAGEERVDTVIFHADSRCCDYIDLFVYMPFVYNDLDLEAEWNITNGNVIHTFYQVNKGERKTLSAEAESELLKTKAFSVLRLRHSLSLWPEWGSQETKELPGVSDQGGAE